MATTDNRGYHYPSPTGDGADVSYWMQRLAEDVDVDVQGLLSLRSHTLLQPVAPYSGWAFSGTVDELVVAGGRRQINYMIEAKRTAAALAYTASAAMTLLGVALPPEVRGSGAGIQYGAVMLSGNGANVLMQGTVNPVDGMLAFRHSSSVTIPNVSNLYFSGTYYINPTP